MKVAVAYNNGEIAENFSSCTVFASYNYTGEFVNECEKSLIDCPPMSDPTAMARLLADNGLEAVICGQMTAEAKNILLSHNVIPIAGFCGDADTAADMLVTGQLPISGGDDGGCSGCCSGCSGCGSDEGSSCGCGDGSCGCGCGGDDDSYGYGDESDELIINAGNN